MGTWTRELTRYLELMQKEPEAVEEVPRPLIPMTFGVTFEADGAYIVGQADGMDHTRHSSFGFGLSTIEAVVDSLRNEPHTIMAIDRDHWLIKLDA